MRSEIPEPLRSFKKEIEPLISELEKRRNAVCFPLLFSMYRVISESEVDEVYDALLRIEGRPNIDVILFSYGGDPNQAYLIGTLLQEFAGERLTIIVPRMAKSAATLLACAADEIMMLPPAELGPIEYVWKNPETGRYVPLRSIMDSIKVIAGMDLKESKFDVIKEALARIPIIELGDFTKLTEHIESLTEKLLKRRMFKNEPEKTKEAAKKLCEGEEYKSHEAPITISGARELGLKVVEVPKEIRDLVWNIHRLWDIIVLSYELTYSREYAEAYDLRIGKGIAFCTIRTQE